jgi:hypothetical protein
VTETLEHTARRIAEQGREALIARLRPAFAEAARARSDVLSFDEDQLEQIVQRAADVADGLQWRRALADVATKELGISLGEALSHPAVARAQSIVGAPSYEESLAALGPAAGDQAKPAQAPAAEQEQEADAGEDEQHVSQAAAPDEGEDPPLQAEEEPEDAETEHVRPSRAAESPATAESPVVPSQAGEEVHTFRLAAVHLGGIANLEPAEQGIALLLSEDGLDIARGPDELLGRLRWSEIRSLDVSPPRGLRRRRRAGAHLVIRTRHGDATFDIPGASSDELQRQLDPLLQKHAMG